MEMKQCVVLTWEDAKRKLPDYLLNNFSFLNKVLVDRSEGDCILWVGFKDIQNVSPHIFTEWEIQDEVNEVMENYEGELFQVYFSNYNYLLEGLLGFKTQLHFTDEEQIVFIEG